MTDPAAERGVIAGCYAHGAEVFVDVEDLITERSFSIDTNGVLFKCLRHLFSQDSDARPDLPSLLGAAQALGLSSQLEGTDEQRHLRAVLNMPVERTNVRKLAKKVRLLEIGRAGVVLTEQMRGGLLAATGEESPDTLIGLLENPVSDFVDGLAATSEDGPRSIGEDAVTWVEYLAANPVTQIGLPTGLPVFDEAMGGGMRPGTVTVIGARPGCGKTTGSINVALKLATGAGYAWPKRDVCPRVPVLYLDTEMGRTDHQLKSLANLSGVGLKTIETGAFAKNPALDLNVRKAAEELGGLPYDMLSIAGQAFEETLSVMKRWVRRRVGLGPDRRAGPCLIVYDYIKLMDAASLSKGLAEFQALGFVMTGLHNFAVRYQVPILCCVQLNRDGINVEDTSAASGSDRIVWLASNFAIYKPQSDEELAAQAGNPPDQRYSHKLVVLKTRHGPGLSRGQFIHIKTDYAIARITEGPTSEQQAAESPNTSF